MAKKIHIIGIGDDALEGLSVSVRALIEQADVLIGSEQTLRGMPTAGKQIVSIGADLSEVIAPIEAAADQRIAVLASGDPLFYGIARFLCDRLGKDRFEVAPNVSSMQLAFARVKESWEDAYLTNLATQPLAKVIDAVRIADKVGFFYERNLHAIGRCTRVARSQDRLLLGVCLRKSRFTRRACYARAARRHGRPAILVTKRHDPGAIA